MPTIEEILAKMPTDLESLTKARRRGVDFMVLPNDQLISFHPKISQWLVFDSGTWRLPMEHDGFEGLLEAGHVSSLAGDRWVAKIFFGLKEETES